MTENSPEFLKDRTITIKPPVLQNELGTKKKRNWLCWSSTSLQVSSAEKTSRTSFKLRLFRKLAKCV